MPMPMPLLLCPRQQFPCQVVHQGPWRRGVGEKKTITINSRSSNIHPQKNGGPTPSGMEGWTMLHEIENSLHPHGRPMKCTILIPCLSRASLIIHVSCILFNLQINKDCYYHYSLFSDTLFFPKINIYFVFPDTLFFPKINIYSSLLLLAPLYMIYDDSSIQ